MSLAHGSRFGPYEIVGALGEGGMGEVYRARDTTLERDVAIKILRPRFTGDQDRLARFEREARLLATFNHPHIAAIHGIVDADGVRGLVLELVEGPTLAERLAAGRLPADEALALARQIASALEAAHDRGIVHRDLKPANIKLTPAGQVKVLDFGIGKIADAGQADATRQRTSGVILGTPAYMSPEQARGQAVDKRTDIWAFGCVLFEMLTGRGAFTAATESDSLARVLEREPDWTLLPASVAPPVQRLLRRCLQKDPAQRLHDIADARIEIDDVADRPAPIVRRRPTTAVTIVAVAAIAASAVLLGLLLTARRPAAPAGLTEFSIPLGDVTPGFGVALSPDGRTLAVGAAVAGQNQIWLHAFDGTRSGPLPGTEFGSSPFWSPDGSSLAFFGFNSGTLFRMSAGGGPPAVICRAAAPSVGGTWSRDDTIVFSAGGALFSVRAAGGTPSPIATPGDDDPRRVRESPQFLPDGRRFIYHSGNRDARSAVAVNVGSLDGTAVTHLIDSERARYAEPGYLLFIRGTALVAQRFDPATLALSGEPALVSADAAAGYLNGNSSFATSANGTLAFMPTRAGNRGQLTWFDRNGRRVRSVAAPGGAEFLNPSIAPAGDRLAVNRQDPQSGRWEVWTIDVDSDSATRVTSGAFDTYDPIWSPDGRSLAFTQMRDNRTSLVVKTLDTSGTERAIEMPDPAIAWTDWTSDGKYLIYAGRTGSGIEVFALPLDGDRTPIQVTRSGSFTYGARVSPDGRWIAYASNEAGPFELYVQRFLVAGQKTKIARGVHPRWTKDGREIVYWAEPGGVAAIGLQFDGDRFRASAPEPIVTTPILTLMDGRPHFDALRSGERFLLRQSAGTPGSSVVTLLNWTERLKK